MANEEGRARKETSDEVSAIAADLMNITADELADQLEHDPKGIVTKIRKVAASARGQDETSGPRG